MVGIEIHMEVRPSRRTELLQAMESLAPPKSGACISHGLFEAVDHHNRFLWRERWTDRGMLEIRVASESFRTLLGAIRVLSDWSRMEVLTQDEAAKVHTTGPALRRGPEGRKE